MFCLDLNVCIYNFDFGNRVIWKGCEVLSYRILGKFVCFLILGESINLEELVLGLINAESESSTTHCYIVLSNFLKKLLYHQEVDEETRRAFYEVMREHANQNRTFSVYLFSRQIFLDK